MYFLDYYVVHPNPERCAIGTEELGDISGAELEAEIERCLSYYGEYVDRLSELLETLINTGKLLYGPDEWSLYKREK